MCAYKAQFGLLIFFFLLACFNFFVFLFLSFFSAFFDWSFGNLLQASSLNQNKTKAKQAG